MHLLEEFIKDKNTLVKFQQLHLHQDHGFPAMNEAVHDKTNKMTPAPNEDSNQPWHPSSLIRVFAVRSVGSQWHKAFHTDSEDSGQTW